MEMSAEGFASNIQTFDLRREQSRTIRPLLSQASTVLLIGGASIVLFLLMKVMLKGNEVPDNDVRWFVYSLCFVVNFPHFLVSYQLLYWDHRKFITKDLRFFWAAVVSPAIILFCLAYGFAMQSPQVLGYLAASLFFFVGWHYVKQIFGGVIVTNAARKYFLNRAERAVLKWNLFSIWAISFLNANTTDAQLYQDGIPYSPLNLPRWTMDYVTYPSIAISMAVLIFLVIRKYLREGQWPSAAAVVCFFSIYVWYLPGLYLPMFAHTVPFFHSIQYLMFVYIFRHNKMVDQHQALTTPKGRLAYLNGVFGYFLIAIITGSTLMYFLPGRIDALQIHNAAMFGATPAYFAFQIFINVHHYFIDNAIWRGTNPEIKKYLFQSA